VGYHPTLKQGLSDGRKMQGTTTPCQRETQFAFNDTKNLTSHETIGKHHPQASCMAIVVSGWRDLN
jgi:hypothetical protein